MIIALCGQKGGSGKSTAAQGIATELMLRGRRVLLVDADPQGTTRTWSDVAGESRKRVPSVVAMGAKMHVPGQLDAVLRSYDDCVIDCPPRHGEIQRSALMVADLAILTCGPSPADAWAMTESVELVNEAKIVRPHLLAFGLINQMRRIAIGAGARDALVNIGLPVFAAELRQRAAHAEAMASGQGITDYEPTSPAAAEVRAVVDELLGLRKGTHAKHKATARRAQATEGRPPSSP
jgi:chromosome partitioning protein